MSGKRAFSLLLKGAQTSIHPKGIEGYDLLHQSLPLVFHYLKFIQWLCNLNIMVANIMESSTLHHLEKISVGLEVFKALYVLGMRTELQIVHLTHQWMF